MNVQTHGDQLSTVSATRRESVWVDGVTDPCILNLEVSRQHHVGIAVPPETEIAVFRVSTPRLWRSAAALDV